MKNLKNIIIYSVLAVLCITAFVSYMASKNPVRIRPVERTADTGSESSDSVKKEADEILSLTIENEANLPKHVVELMRRAAEEPDPNPIIGIGRGEDYAKVTAEAIENAGGLKDCVNKGDTVLIKPNICTLTGEEDHPCIVDHRAVQQIVNMVLELGASRVIVAEGPIFGNPFAGSAVKLNKYNAIQNAELLNINDLDKEDCYELKPLKSVTGKAIFIPKVYMDANVVINVAKLKTHSLTEALATLSLKNLFGVPPQKVYGQTGNKYGLHKLGIKEAIVDINRIRRPDFAVIEGIVGGQGMGPVENQPVKSNIVFAGKDPVALDTAALTFMGLKVEEVLHVQFAGEQKLGIADLDKIKIVGADLASIKMKFDVVK